jgi:hypothetical protein
MNATFIACLINNNVFPVVASWSLKDQIVKRYQLLHVEI